MKKVGIFIAIILISCFLNPTNSKATFVSTFDFSAEGWTAYATAPGGVSPLQYDATGGNPGGNIRAIDTGSGVWFFEGPSSWSGDWTKYIGGTISFDVFVDPDENRNFSDPTQSPTIAIDLGEAQDGIYLGWNRNSNPLPEQWTSFEVAINSTNFQVIGSSLSFEEAIKQTTGLFILGDYLEGIYDFTRLDNVQVKPIPEPATILLLGAGLIGLANFTRKGFMR